MREVQDGQARRLYESRKRLGSKRMRGGKERNLVELMSDRD